MATPNTATADDTPWDLTQTDAPTAAPPSPDYSGASPEVKAALLNQPAAATDAPIDYGAIARQLVQQPTLPQVDTTPVTRGLLSRLGEALGGGQMSGVMSPAQQEMAGLRALQHFGTSLIAGSGYHPGQPALGAFATGFEGAAQSERGSEQGAAATLAAQQQYAAGQQQQYLERVKAALPLLTLDQQSRQAAAARALAGAGGGPAVPGTATGAGGGNYEGTIASMEGTGKNLRSSSSGVGGFLDSTWQDFASANPDLFKGMSPAQVMAAKSDPGLGAKAITWLAQRNADVLGNSNIAPTGQTLGIAHRLGPGPVPAIMAAPDNAPVANFVSPAALQANDDLKTMTVGQLKQRYANVPNPGFLKPAGGAQPAAPYNVATSGNAVPGPPGGSTTPAGTGTAAGTSAPDLPWNLPAAPSGAPTIAPPPTPPLPDAPAPDPTAAPAPVQPVAPAHPDIPVPGGGVISHPGEFSDYRAKQLVPPTGEDFNPNLAPEQQQAFATKAQQLQLAQQQVSTLPFAEQPKALIEVKAKQAELAAAQQDAIAAKRQAAAANVTKYNETQQKDIQTRYDAAAAAYNTAAQGSLTSQNKIAEINAQTDATSRGKVLDQLDAEQSTAHENLTQLQLVKALSDAAGQPGILSSYPELRSWLVKTGIATDAQAQQWSAQQALDAATSKLTLAMRAGTGMSRVTNMDLQFLKNASPQSFNPQDWRNAQIAYLQTLYERQQKFAGLVHRGVADKMSLSDAMTDADKELGSTIFQTPTVLKGQPLDKTGQDRANWDNLTPGQFYKDTAGNLKIFKPPPNATRP